MDNRLKILITGGNGYIAKSLFNNLRDKYDTTIISRVDFDLTNAELTNVFFKDKFFDVVIHCAVKGGSRLRVEDSTVIDHNLKMYYNILNNRLRYGKLIHFGSGAELYAKDTPYGLSKHIIRESILDKDALYNIRIFAVFDENELETRFIKSNIKRYINNEPIRVHQNKYMSYFYMEDLLKVVDYYIQNDDAPKEFDCCYSENNTLIDIANIINQLDDYKVDIITDTIGMGESYKGIFQKSNIHYVGIEHGIKKVFNKLKTIKKINYD